MKPSSQWTPLFRGKTTKECDQKPRIDLVAGKDPQAFEIEHLVVATITQKSKPQTALDSSARLVESERPSKQLGVVARGRAVSLTSDLQKP